MVLGRQHRQRMHLSVLSARGNTLRMQRPPRRQIHADEDLCLIATIPTVTPTLPFWKQWSIPTSRPSSLSAK